MAGDTRLRDLNVEEAVVFDAEISTAIDESLAGTDYGNALAARGVTHRGH